MRELPSKSCPAEAADAERKEKSRNAIVTDAAQALLDRSGSPADIHTQLVTDLSDYHEAMLRLYPDRAEYTITKYVNKAFEGAFMHLAGDKLIQSTLPIIQADKTLIPDPEVLPSCRNVAYPRGFDEPYNTYLQSGVYWLRNATRELYADIESIPGHPYAPLLVEYNTIHTQYADLRHKNEPEFTFTQGLKHFRHVIEVDNVFTTLAVMVERDMTTSESVSKDEITRRVLGDVDKLSWLARVNRNVIWHILKFPC